jgi:pimeloyl-ACP methyl ester carboxylesterase
MTAKKAIQFFKFCSFLSLCLALLPFLCGCSNSLTSDQIATLKANERFWQWQSSYGTFNIHYVEKGQGTRHVILLHGLAANTYTWHYLTGPLAKAGYHVWSLDLLGYGLSDKPETAAYGLELFTAQIKAFMQDRGIEQAHFIGNSMGGGLALSMAIFHPQNARSLTLIDALGYPLQLPLPLKISRLLGKAMPPLFNNFIMRQALEQIVYDPRTITDKQVAAYSTPLKMPGGKEAFAATLQSFDNEQIEWLSQHYSHIHIPTLLIWGSQDQWIPLSHYQQFLHDFPHTQAMIISNCGHIPQEECPQRVLEAILHFLSQFP